MKQNIERRSRRGLAFGLGVALLTVVGSARAHEVEPIDFSEIGIPYSWGLEISAGETAETPPDHVGAWSWDEDTFPATTRGWTHTSKFVKLELTTPALFTLTLSNLAGVPWPSAGDPGRLAGTNLYPSFTLYKGWDTDAGITFDTNGVTIGQDHTFNNRGNIEWAEDVTYLDHLENTNSHSTTRTWLLPAGQYTINLGGNSPATIAEGRQGYIAIFTAAPAPVAISNAALAGIDFSEVGIPYGIGLTLDDSSYAETLPDHVGAWSWDEDGFPATARGWTHTSKFVKLDLLKPAVFTLTLSNLANVPWPSAGDPGRLAGTNLYPSFTLYKDWDTDGGVPLDQDHTFNNRGNIEWAEDVTYLDHLENTNSHTTTRTWILAAGRYTINLGGNSPATIAEGRQGYKAVFTTTPAPVAISNAVLHDIEFSEVGIPYGIGLTMDDNANAETLPDHVGAWSWDEDGFPATARGWTHTSKFVKLDLLQAARFTLTLSNLAGVPWPSAGDPGRLAGTNLYPSFTLYQGWDTDAGITFDTNGVSIDQDHTFNNRGNIEWAEDVQYVDHLENTNSHTVTRTWSLPAGHYTINLGGNSPATVAEGRQGYKAVFTTTPAAVLLSGLATIHYDETAWNALAANFGPPPVLTLSGFFDQAAANAVTSDQLLTNAQSGYSYLNQLYAMNGLAVTNLARRTTQPTTCGWVPGNPTNQTGSIGLGGVARFAVLGGLGGSLLYGDFTLQYDSGRLALGGTGWYLKNNIPPAAAVYDLLNVTVVETANSLSVSGDLGVSFEVANFLYSTPADWLRDVGDFNFTGYTVPLTAPVISGVSRSGGNLILRAANGLPGSTAVLFSATNITSSAWTPAGTVLFDANGSSSNAIPINPGQPARFFRLRQP